MIDVKSIRDEYDQMCKKFISVGAFLFPRDVTKIIKKALAAIDERDIEINAYRNSLDAIYYAETIEDAKQIAGAILDGPI